RTGAVGRGDRPVDHDGVLPGDRLGGQPGGALSVAVNWRMDVPEGWVAWEPGSPDLPALQTAARTTGRAARALARRGRVAEQEVELLPGEVHQLGVRVDPHNGQ